MHIFSLFVHGFFTPHSLENPLYLTYLTDRNHRGNAMKKAEWILRSHREHLATEKLLEAKLQQVLDISEEEKDDYIEAQMLKHAQIDGMPRTSCQESRTERVALSYMTDLRTERQDQEAKLRSELQKTRYYLRIYDALMASLTPEESWLAQERYVNGKSLGRLLLEMPDEVGIRSKTTLNKRCAQTIDKIDGLLAKIA